jgi:hypothetical protein
MYISRVTHEGYDSDAAKEHYLEVVRNLKKEYGVWYDPIKLDHS